jgi:hypothetical protein
MFNYKRTAIKDSDRQTKLFVSTVKTSNGYETRIVKACENTDLTKYPIAEVTSKTWLGSRINHMFLVIQAEGLIHHN